MVGKVKEIVDETTNKWDILFVEKEKKEEKDKQKIDKCFTKVYQKCDKGKNKVSSIPKLTIKDNLPPPVEDILPVVEEKQVEEQAKEQVKEQVEA